MYELITDIAAAVAAKTNKVSARFFGGTKQTPLQVVEAQTVELLMHAAGNEAPESLMQEIAFLLETITEEMASVDNLGPSSIGAEVSAMYGAAMYKVQLEVLTQRYVGWTRARAEAVLVEKKAAKLIVKAAAKAAKAKKVQPVGRHRKVTV